jgi:hypothetical protein
MGPFDRNLFDRYRGCGYYEHFLQKEGQGGRK